MGVKTRLGKVVGSVQPGLHMKMPIIEKVTKIAVRNRVVKNEHYTNEKGDVISDNALAAASKDLQNVNASSVVSYSIDQSKIIAVFSEYKTAENYEEAVIKPIIKQVIKSKTAEYTAEELVTKRTLLNDSVAETLRLELSNRYAIFNNSSVTNIEFSPSFTQAIERKVTAEQDALAQKNKLEQVKYEAEQQVVKAKAEAETISLKSQAANNEKYVSLKALEVQEKAVEKWNGVLPTQMIPGSTVPFINLSR
jgi:regulator of protease activity HflC (stomatin/prohibitin superfamily)